jgi:secretion/DNA translocation related TadE-like protein
MTVRRPCRHPDRRAGGRPDERGSGAIWTLAAVIVVLLMATVVVDVGAAVVARHRAGSAADLAALAAAERAQQGWSDGCARAARVALAAGGRLRHCVVSGAVADVTVEVPAAGLGHRLGTAVGRARAGPAGS